MCQSARVVLLAMVSKITMTLTLIGIVLVLLVLILLNSIRLDNQHRVNQDSFFTTRVKEVVAANIFKQ